MDQEKLDLVVENEREWRTHMFKRLESMDQKIDRIDGELATFKLRVLGFASAFGGFAGISADFIKGLFQGG